MSDVIQLLPDSVANQIAAGEVIQRPASVVKELLENALDAGASEIRLVIKEAGKLLIQVVDNGSGMSETDARLCFERHATSKIRDAADLFSIRTMGFRGEAMASIAAIAQVELKTRRKEDELGIRIQIEGSRVEAQEAIQHPVGTNISVKNLFFNVPARRNFLKSNPVELRHINDEFTRIAIAHPGVFFSLHHNNNEIFHLLPANQRQRIVSVLGANTNKKLVPVQEETDVVSIDGFVGKPEFSKKTRGEQYFFVNRRFIKSPYLHHAINAAYEDLISKEHYPSYVIFLEIDPKQIDINVHPTKQEIKFEDERLIYNYLKVAVRHALGKHNLTPTLDFDQSRSFSYAGGASSSGEGAKTFSGGSYRKPNEPVKEWEKVYADLATFDPPTGDSDQPAMTIASAMSKKEDANDLESMSESSELKAPYQIHNRYIVSQIKSGYLLIDQRVAHQRILYEKYLRQLSQQQAGTQVALFAKTIHINPSDTPTLKEILPLINQLGFDLKEFGQDAFVLQGTPADFDHKLNEQRVIEELLEQFKSNLELHLNHTENLARSLAISTSVKKGQSLGEYEMRALIDQLFACEIPFKGPTGRKCFIAFELEELDLRFNS
ncbi:MAG: DNA mismatch repair endonuclease MutL [Saprospiraceae bacterium]|nr:DNA mismatch repair endonuclease MutL [Saprospiraceae bacterium]